LEVIRAAATGHEALTTDPLVDLEEESAVEYVGEARAAQRDRLNQQEAHPSGLRRSARLVERCASDRPLQLLKAAHYCRIRKCPGREGLRVEAPVSAAHIWHGAEDGVAK
jgi:hypothetical protein